MFGQIASTVILAVSSIFLARFLGADQYGVYTIVLIPVAIVFLIQDMGTSPAFIRFCAMYRHEERTGDLREVIKTGLIFVSLTSMALSVALYLSSGLIASVFLRRPELEYLVKTSSFAVFGSGLYGAVQSIFVGNERMGLRSIIDVFWSLSKSVIMISLVLIGLGTGGAVLSNVLGYLMTGLLGVILILVYIRPGRDSQSQSSSRTLGLMLAYGLPAYAGSLLSGGLLQWYNSLMTLNVSTILIGNYSAASNFGVLVGFITMPIGTTLFPLFSRLRRDDPQLALIFRKAVKYTTLVTTPVMALLILVSGPLTRIIYGGNYTYVALYLSLYLLGYGFEGLGGTSLTNFIMGMGESKVILLMNAATLLLGAPLALILIPRFQIVGLIVTSLIAPRVGWLIGYAWVKKKFGITVGWLSSARVYLCSAVSFAVGYLALNLLHVTGWVALVAGSAIFFAFYLMALPLSRTLSRKDVDDLRVIAKTTGPLDPVIGVILSLLERLTRV
jgi:O-antigen/teichoic acid export membrane protein